MLKRLRASFRRFLYFGFKQRAVIAFLGGCVLTAAVSLGIDEWPKIHLPTFLVFVSILIIYAVFAAEQTRRDIDKKLDQLELTTICVLTEKEMYQRGIEDVRSAKKRILVIGPHLPLGTAGVMTEDERSGYVGAIEEVIRTQQPDPSGSVFVYQRVIQTTMAAEAVNGVLTQKLLMESPPGFFDHCKQLEGMIPGGPEEGVEVGIRVSEPLPSLSSVLIVDSKFLHIAFPSRRKPAHGETDETFRLEGAMVIEDRTGRAIEKFVNKVFQPIYGSSSEISKIGG